MRGLIFSTRDLCYYSASFFADRIADSLEEKGESIVRADIPEDTDEGEIEETLLKLSNERFDFILDFNSKLPRMKNEKGVPYLDTIMSVEDDNVPAPFYNYILDHPLYHHPGLSQSLKNYHALVIDRYHGKYISDHYPDIKEVIYRPLPGSRALTEIPFEERNDRLLFPGTYVARTLIEHEIERLYSEKKKRLIKDLFYEWDPEEKPLEEAVLERLTEEEKELEPFTVLMNSLYPLDRLMRYERRRRLLFFLAERHAAIDIQGEGWEDTGIYSFPNVKRIAPSTMASSIEIMAGYKKVLDVNPCFFEGLHDRVSSALENRCIVFSDMSEKTAPDDENLRLYSFHKLENLLDGIRSDI